MKFFNLLFLTIFVVFFYSTLLSAYLKGVVLYSLMTLWLITALIIDTSWLKKSKLFVLSVLVYIAIVFLDSIIIQNYTNIMVMLKSQIYSFMFMLMGVFYSRNYKKFNMRIFIYILFAALISSYIATIMGLKVYPNASRYLASFSNPLCFQFKKMGIGGFGFIYSTPYLIAVMIFMMNSKIKLSNQIILFVLIGLFGYAVIKSNYTTAVVTVFLAIGLGVIFVSGKNIQLKIIVVAFVGIFALVTLPYILKIVLNLISNKDSIIWMRIDELLQSLTKPDVEFNRVELMKKSIMAFIHNPFVGEFGVQMKSIGGHSDFVDCFGMYGLVGAIVYNSIFLSVALYQYKQLRNKKVQICYIILQGILLLNRVTNPILVSQNISGSAFLICPILLMYIDNYCLGAPKNMLASADNAAIQLNGDENNITLSKDEKECNVESTVDIGEQGKDVEKNNQA